MGWGYGVNNDGREIGYSVEAVCDLEGCEEEIDRGLAFVCGGMHDADEFSCGNYFCGEHMFMGIGLPAQLCGACADAYRAEHPDEVAAAVAEFEEQRAVARGEL